MFRTRHYSQQWENSPSRQVDRNMHEVTIGHAHDFLWEFGGALDTEHHTAKREAASATIHSLDKALAYAG